MGWNNSEAVLEIPDPKDKTKMIRTPEGEVVRAWKITALVAGAIAAIGVGVAISLGAKLRRRAREDVVVVSP